MSAIPPIERRVCEVLLKEMDAFLESARARLRIPDKARGIDFPNASAATALGPQPPVFSNGRLRVTSDRVRTDRADISDEGRALAATATIVAGRVSQS